MPIYALGEREPMVAADAFVHPEAVVIGAVTIGSQSSVWPMATLDASVGTIIIGDRTSVQDGTRVCSTSEHSVLVGDDCVIGHLALLEGCTIGDRVMVGSGSEVHTGALVEQGAVVGAKAVIEEGGVVPASAMALGRPATIRPDAANAEMIAIGSTAYVRRTAQYRAGLRRID